MPKPSYPATVNAASTYGNGLLVDVLFDDGSGNTARNNADTSRNLSWVGAGSAVWTADGTDTRTGYWSLNSTLSAALQLPVSGGYSIEVIIRRMTGETASGTQEFFRIKGSNGCTDWGGFLYSGGNVNFYTVQNSCVANSLEGGNLGGTPEYNVEVIHYLVTMSASGVKKVYKNGVLRLTGSHTGPVQTDSGNTLRIGEGFPGEVELIRLWDWELSGTDAANLHSDPYPSDLYSAGGGALAVGTPTLDAADPTSVELSAVITGGTAPYTGAWQRAPTAEGTFTSIGAGSIATNIASITHTPPDDEPYWYRVAITDSAGTPATVTSDPQVGATQETPIFIGFIGDSLMLNAGAYGDTAETVALRLTKLSPRLRSVTIDNQGIGGTGSSNWLPGGSNYNTAVASFAAAVSAAGVTAGNKYVILRLGTNSAGLSDMSSIANALVALGYKVFIAAPPGNAALDTNDRLQLLIAQLETLDNGDTIRFGAKRAFTHFVLNNAAETSDGTHMNAAGVESDATILAEDFHEAFLDTNSGGAVSIPAMAAFGGAFN